MSDELTLQPISLRAANAWIDEVHRHHGPVTGHKFSTSVVRSAQLVGVGVAGRPVSRQLDAQGFIEIVRIASDGTPNVCSMLYGALRTAAKALGYPAHKVITYTLASEPGTSLRAAGFILGGTTGGGSWSRDDRPRIDKHPTEPKSRWVGGKPPVVGVSS